MPKENETFEERLSAFKEDLGLVDARLKRLENSRAAIEREEEKI